MYQGASNFAQGVDNTFMFIFAISVFFLVVLTATMIWFVIKYNRKKHPNPTQIKDSLKLEVTWTVIPLILVLAMFYYGYVVYKPMRNAPDDAIPIKVVGRMWDWTFEYPNGKMARELVVPLDKPIKLVMNSADVIHSLYIPAFRIKEDLVPGQETYMWFIPTIQDTFEILCAEYCGLRHAFMTSKAIVIPESDYETWLITEGQGKDEHPGLLVLQNNACMSCHSMDGSKLVGPSFKGLFNARRTIVVDKQEIQITVDGEYIKKSILDPDSEIVKGYAPKLMRSYKDVISEEELDQIVDYFIKEGPI